MNIPCPICKAMGTIYLRQTVLEGDYNITEEFIDRKLFCGRCLGRKVICKSCLGHGYQTVKIGYGGGFEIACPNCKCSGLAPPEKDETQEITT